MLTSIILFSGFAGITVFVGGLLAYYFNHHIKESPVKFEIIHTLMSFGAGIILSALASYVLSPQIRAFSPQLDPRPLRKDE